jgi:hypothetical protein
MEWIKKNPHLMALVVCALALVTGSAVLALNARGFETKFSGAQEQVVPGDKLAPLDLEPLTTAKDRLLKPELWEGSALFVPERYVVNPITRNIEKVVKTSFFKDSLTGQDIPNSWFIDHHQSLSDSKIPFADPDGDGFVNEDEWRGPDVSVAAAGKDSTDPEKKESHPPYYTKLFLKQYIRVQFRLRFMSTDGDPKKPAEMSFQINTLDLKQPSEFLRLGDMVPKTKYKLQKYEFKEVPDPNNGGDKDVSELTVVNTETSDSIVLVKERVTDSPDSFADLVYEWHLPGKPQLPVFRVKKTGKFVLPPENKEYKLLDITDNSAKIQTPEGDIKSVGIDRRLH